jgi:flagella basal body P-ring formation protein FlgA
MKLACFCLAAFASHAIDAAPSAKPVWTAEAKDAVNLVLSGHPSLEARQFEVQWKDPKIGIPNCPMPIKVEPIQKEKAWGQVFVTLKCESSKPWVRPGAIYVAVNGRYMVAARTLKAGQVLGPTDWRWAEGELSKMADNVLEDPELVKDLELSRNFQPNSAFRLNDFRAMAVIKMGDQVRVSMVGRAFTIDASGQALADAPLGATVRVKIADGKIIQGRVVSPGSVEVLLE